MIYVMFSLDSGQLCSVHYQSHDPSRCRVGNRWMGGADKPPEVVVSCLPG